MKKFIIVIDNEVAGKFPVPYLKDENGNILPSIEELIAVLSSDPKIIPWDEDVEKGWVWDGTTFAPPVE